MRHSISVGDWRLSWVPNRELAASGASPKTAREVEASGRRIIEATVPGNYELDFLREGLLDDLYYGQNCLKTQGYENLHLYYFTEFEYKVIEGCDATLTFGGVDTAAYIYLDGEELGFVENMLHPHRFSLSGVSEGRHEIFVHILPITIYSRKFDPPAMCFGLPYNHDGITVRKPGSMFGWDIMPRIVSGGLWKPVTVEYLPVSRIKDAYTYTDGFLGEGYGLARLYTTLKIESDEDFITDFTVVIKGKCGDSEFVTRHHPFCASMRIETRLCDPKLWWPRNYGEPNLYDVTVSLYLRGELCDEVSYRMGVRTVDLIRTSCAGDGGEFCFYVNDKRIFVMGTNWVPCDALPSRHDELTLRNIALANDLGCNMIRCWGGNVYPSDLLYDYCDEHGIMIWQDFSLACGHYPDDDRLCRLVKEEVRQVVIERRQHASLAIWAGDNECDVFIVVPHWDTNRLGEKNPCYIDPNLNKLTREVIMREVRNHDATRPYLPSSPYLDERAYITALPAEDHLWGPRDYFKGDYYGGAQAHFASEIGYHGCPSPDSIRKFIRKESLPRENIREICTDGDWLVHAAGMVPYVEGNLYAYRLELMIQHVERLFGTAPSDLGDFARASQISQAEAKKYFIERFRVKKWVRTGILWWNVADGWPQISDAVVDWYGTKKLAYHYIARSQQPLCLMCDEPINDVINLVYSSDARGTHECSYTVTDLVTGEAVASGKFVAREDCIDTVATLPDSPRAFYLIEWHSDLGNGKNHFATHIGDGWTLDEYTECMKKAGFYDEFEGF